MHLAHPQVLRVLYLPQEKGGRLLCEMDRGCRPQLEVSLHFLSLKMMFLAWRHGTLKMLHSLSHAGLGATACISVMSPLSPSKGQVYIKGHFHFLDQRGGSRQD